MLLQVVSSSKFATTTGTFEWSLVCMDGQMMAAKMLRSSKAAIAFVANEGLRCVVN